MFEDYVGEGEDLLVAPDVTWSHAQQQQRHMPPHAKRVAGAATTLQADEVPPEYAVEPRAGDAPVPSPLVAHADRVEGVQVRTTDSAEQMQVVWL